MDIKNGSEMNIIKFFKAWFYIRDFRGISSRLIYIYLHNDLISETYCVVSSLGNVYSVVVKRAVVGYWILTVFHGVLAA